ncbi:methyl-CpG-binding domain-containing protein 8-like [Bidens hawaiensis]|uniref:methyl-CpG-binding domain-containing protein 8-like n=1 Tax=Bidens hawaiensis TaxID=980011 RepID=UPI00404A6CAA
MTTTVATDRPPSVPVVDLSLLSQSELYTLSLSSDAYDLNHDLVIPKINRAVFNESAGSRKQTYSRLRLASDDVTKTTTLHRRTPHLRAPVTHPANNNNNNNINDPEQAENTVIIRMLKQLCKSDPNFQDIDLIDDDNDNNNNNNITIPVAAEFLNHETLGLKRKRGRPRKHENVVFIRPPTGKRIRDNNINNNDTFINPVKKEVVFDDEKDREIVSENGVVVDLVRLGGLEDPYGEEIRRRTVGMTTEDELLGFLRGLNGHWGSRRRKRRVVAAAEFGDVLPKGWKMSLCIKKKEGRVWLFCRRYLSPSGRQFESFKEISTYLISVIGEENLDKQNVLHANGSNDSTLKEASVCTANLVQQEDIKRDDPVDNPPPPSPRMPSVSVNCEVQVKNDRIGSHPQTVPANCEVQVSLDAMDAQVETNVKSDHNGPHVKNETEKTDSLPAELDNSDLVLPGDTALVETDDPHAGDKINECKESNTDELVQDLNVLKHL